MPARTRRRIILSPNYRPPLNPHSFGLLERKSSLGAKGSSSRILPDTLRRDMKVIWGVTALLSGLA